MQNHRREFFSCTTCLVPVGAGLLNNTLCVSMLCLKHSYTPIYIYFFVVALRSDGTQCHCLQNECELMSRMRFRGSRIANHIDIGFSMEKEKKMLLSSKVIHYTMSFSFHHFSFQSRFLFSSFTLTFNGKQTSTR